MTTQKKEGWRELEKQILEKFSFVQWDRYTLSKDKTEVNFYGWIEREDSYKDFLVLTRFRDSNMWWFLTSSSQYDLKIKKILKFEDGGSPCIRVERNYKIKNVIHLPVNTSL